MIEKKVETFTHHAFPTSTDQYNRYQPVTAIARDITSLTSAIDWANVGFKVREGAMIPGSHYAV